MGGDGNVPCDLLTLLMLRHAGVGGGDGNVPCDWLSLLMLRHAGVAVGGDVNVPCDLLTLLMLRHAGVGGGDGNVPCKPCQGICGYELGAKRLRENSMQSVSVPEKT